jgi:hypothetical protein
MRSLTSALLAAALIAAPIAADAAPKKKHVDREQPPRVAPNSTYGAPIRDIDETRYYERLSEKIPFGSATWWRQKQLENPTP